ncbi:MAG: rhomboid family intramembrane serine protease [Aeoliella sp.]
MKLPMGMYDRDYQHHEYGQQPGMHLRAPQSMTVKLIIITAVVYVVQLMFGPEFTDLFANHAGWYKQPWRVFELLTAGFLHSTREFTHLLFNMVVLWFFGKAIEEKYGSQEFLAFYIAAIIFSSLCWDVATWLEFRGDFGLYGPLGPMAVGASGGLAAILLLFAINYPHAKVLLFMVIPIKAWMAGILWVGIDIFGALRNAEGDNIGYAAHLGGFLFGFLYYKFGWRLMDWIPGNLSMPKFKRRPPLRVHRPTADDEDNPMEDELDRVLKKIKEQGQDSLNAKERRTLQRASRTYKQKRK